MSQSEAESRRSGARMVLWSAGLGLAGVGPLLLYIEFGPADGNPIGLGLLAMVSVPAAGCGIVLGLVRMLIEALVGGGR